MPAGLSYDLDGNQTLIFIREVPGSGWMIGPDLLRQPVNVVANSWQVDPGWLIAGPKRSLEQGNWNVQLDIVQEPSAKFVVQVVANSGLDVLLDLTVSGAFCGNLCVEIKNEHRFVELRLKIVEAGSRSYWIRPRDISMMKNKSETERG
jgi:hypothetical protein